jgi:DNA-binding beta-propeller fold protein YncE
MRLYRMNSGQTRARLVQAGAALAVAALAGGCGNQYRPVITPINNPGPAAQPQSYAAAVSAPSPSAPGIATIIDYSGDSIMAQAQIGPGPTTFTVDQGGVTGYTYNSDGTLTNFSVSPGLVEKNVTYSTLPSGADPAGIFSPSAGLWIADLSGNAADVMTGSPAGFRLAVPVATTPVSIVGLGTIGQRNYAISQGFDDPSGVACNLSPTAAPVNGVVTPMEVSSYSPDQNIVLDPNDSTGSVNARCPVFGVLSSDGRRLFVLNRGSDTVSVIDTLNDTLDTCTPFLNQAGQKVTCHPILPLSLTAVDALNAANPGSGNPPNGTGGMTATAGPVYAEYNAATAQLVVANYDGGTISVIDVSEDEYGNDSPAFGTTYTVPVGNNPASVTVLAADGSRAYTANQGDETVSIVNLSSHTVEKPALPVTGHPRTVVSTQNSEYGKVYVASPDSLYLTILRTDLDIVDTTMLLNAGNIVDVRVSTQTGTSGNRNNNSRTPGHGEPCNLPNVTGGYQAAGGTVQPTSSLANCMAQDPSLLAQP